MLKHIVCFKLKDGKVTRAIRTCLKAVHFGAFHLISSCRAQSPTAPYQAKIAQNLLALRSKILKGAGFFLNKAQNAVNTVRIDEYFNAVQGEIRSFKTGSDYSCHLTRVQETADVLRSMQGKVPMLRGIEVGVDELRSPRSYDVMLTVLLDDMAALDAYQQDAYHVDVVKKHMHAVMENSVSMDYTV